MSKKETQLERLCTKGLIALSLSLFICLASYQSCLAQKGKVYSKAGFASGGKSKLRKNAKLEASPPESGVKLLLGILRRIGSNTPKIAMAPPPPATPANSNVLEQAVPIFQQQNAVDVSQVIRPTASQESKLAKKQKPKPFYMLASNKSGGRKGWYTAPGAGAPATRGLSAESEKRLTESVGKLYNITSTLSSMQKAARNAGRQRTPSPHKIINTSGEPLPEGVEIASPRKVMDYNNKDRMLARRSNTRGSLRAGLAPPPAPAEFSADNRIAGIDTSNAARKKLDQPGAYKYFTGGVGDKGLGKYRGKNKNVVAWGRREVISTKPSRSLSYVPPSLVAGVPGLPLGSMKSQVVSFLKGHGKVAKSSINDWDVWSLRNSAGATRLQVYMRNGAVEAFRIYDRRFVPDRLGIDLGDNIRRMKEKFGEPSFWLSEPIAKTRGVNKNYVYPVSQVSFQLARTHGKGEPVVQSLLLFKFI